MKPIECRCIRHGLVVSVFREANPPPTWFVVDRVKLAERQGRRTFTESSNTIAIARDDMTVRFEYIGVEVDTTGTWVRYEESPT